MKFKEKKKKYIYENKTSCKLYNILMSNYFTENINFDIIYVLKTIKLKYCNYINVRFCIL
ncbi:hypothetical protein PFAG_03259 [Plasmodium falciparum Santa Lucia]|uniref:Uncharacterized protein n=2 Tax=Plasmodium falciparum TaxID=5833 RepID=W7FTX6_PLAFA|nr:hypothetical protein PFNF135_03426 [Plasmodium falciparum NF135/5.C10]EUT84168.1 hypothetical protein PFAG_03259 [Plasmodium falciparum Santa Lucia]